MLLNSAAAIVLYFVLPIAFNIIATLWTRMQDIAPWIDLGTSQPPLFSGDEPDRRGVGAAGHQARRSGSCCRSPVGLWRVMRAEVK